jgi:hypothetical protein
VIEVSNGNRRSSAFDGWRFLLLNLSRVSRASFSCPSFIREIRVICGLPTLPPERLPVRELGGIRISALRPLRPLREHAVAFLLPPSRRWTFMALKSLRSGAAALALHATCDARLSNLMSSLKYSLGLDYGTNSMPALSSLWGGEVENGGGARLSTAHQRICLGSPDFRTTPTSDKPQTPQT